MTKRTVAIFVSVVALAGCANQLLSDDRIRDNTAMALGVPTSAVTISDRRYDGATNTYYVAHTPRGFYNCLINGGNHMAMGMTNLPDCASVASGVAPRSASRLLTGR